MAKLLSGSHSVGSIGEGPASSCSQQVPLQDQRGASRPLDDVVSAIPETQLSRSINALFSPKTHLTTSVHLMLFKIFYFSGYNV